LDCTNLLKDEFILEKVSSVPFIFGENNEFLYLIQKLLDVEIKFRGENFVIQSQNAEKIMIAKEMVSFLYHRAVLRKNVSLKEIEERIHTYLIEKKLDSSLLKTFSVNGKSVKLKNKHQQEFFDSLSKNTLCFGVGAAGTGKTYLAIAYALSELYAGNIHKIILTRPVVEAGENLGFLPGTLEEKIAPYLKPLMDAIESLISEHELSSLLQKGIIEIVPLAYMRGRSLNNATIILDEAQNTNYLQMKMFLTRLGLNSKIIITGDLSQKDLPLKTSCGLAIALKILKNIESVSSTYFTKEDSVRHPLVAKMIGAFEKYETTQKVVV
jgi:phosphate starvation-inducible PhoH-like protein